MSERWRKCRMCGGSGEVVDKLKPVPEYYTPQKEELIFSRKACPEKRYFGKECGECDGTGWTGYAMDCPF